MKADIQQSSPAQVANECEAFAQMEIDLDDPAAAKTWMRPAHAIRRALKTLHRLNTRIHSGYDFNADPDGLTLEVGQVLEGYNVPEEVGRVTPPAPHTSDVSGCAPPRKS